MPKKIGPFLMLTAMSFGLMLWFGWLAVDSGRLAFEIWQRSGSNEFIVGKVLFRTILAGLLFGGCAILPLFSVRVLFAVLNAKKKESA
jgi:hypothetical protein